MKALQKNTGKELDLTVFAIRCNCRSWMTGNKDTIEMTCFFCNQKWYRKDKDTWSISQEQSTGDEVV